MTRPEQLTYLQAEAVARAGTSNIGAKDHRKAILTCLQGDHWRNADGWVGPRLPIANPLAADFLEQVRLQFIPKNALKEISDRHIGAVIGRYPLIKLALRDATAKPTDSQVQEMKEGEGALTAWLDTVRALGKFQLFATHLLLGEGHLRGYVPSGALRDGRIPSGDLLTSIRRIRMQVPEPGSTRIVDDEATGNRYAVYQTKDAQDRDVSEISYLTDTGQTVVRRVQSGSVLLGANGLPAPGAEASTPALELHGLLPIVEAIRDQFLTPTLLRNNMMLNFAKTAILRNAELAAVLERYGINILPPGQWVVDINAVGGLRFEQDPAYRPGGANATFFNSAYGPGTDGNLAALGSGQYGRFEPVKPDALIATKEDAYHDMLDEACQSHIRMSGDASASGESRIQAMNDFKASLYRTATSLEGSLSEFLECILAWASALSGKPGQFKAYRVVVQCRITAAQPTMAERAQLIAERDAGLRNSESAMSEIGIEDTDQMLAAVREERELSLQEGQQAAAALGKILDPVPVGA